MPVTNRKLFVISTAILLIVAVIATLWINAVQKIVQTSPSEIMQVSQTHSHGDSEEHTH